MPRTRSENEAQSATARGSRRPRGGVWLYGGIGLLALAVRLFFLGEIRSESVFGLLLGDAYTYDAWAREIAGGDWIGQQVFYQAPLYPYFLGVVYAIFDHSLTAARIIQALLGSASCVLLALAGRFFLDRRTGLLAGLLLALYPPAIFYDGTIQKTSLAGFLMAGVLCLLGRFVWKPARRYALLAGCALGLLALTRENALIFAPVLVLWMIVAPADRARRARLTWTAVLVAGLLIVLVPVALRNTYVGKEFGLTTSQLGPNFYIGNHAGADGTYGPLRPGRGDARYERIDAQQLAEQALGRALTPREVSQYWAEQALDYIRSEPGDWLHLMGRKVLLTLGAVEIGDTEDIYTYREWSRVLRYLSPVLHFGVISVLAAFGLVMTWPRRRDLAVLYTLAVSYTLAVITMFVFGRYRFPLALLLILFAAAGLVAARDALSKPHLRRGLGIALLAAALAAVASNWPLVRSSSFVPATHCNIAYALIEQRGDYQLARAHLASALVAAPEYANAHHLMGVIASNAGRLDEAEEHYRRALALEPERALTHLHLGQLLVARGEIPAAIELLRKALSLDPQNASAHNNLGTILAGEGEYEEAIRHIAQALALDPGAVDTRYNLGLVLAQSGDPERAERAFREVLRLAPGHPGALHNLVTLHLLSGNPAEAVAELRQTLSRTPDDMGAMVRLAWLLATHETPAVRDGAAAESLARELCRRTEYRDPQLLDLLAAANAEVGRFELAREAAQQAVVRAEESGDQELALQLRQHLELYQREEPLRRSWP